MGNGAGALRVNSALLPEEVDLATAQQLLGASWDENRFGPVFKAQPKVPRDLFLAIANLVDPEVLEEQRKANAEVYSEFLKQKAHDLAQLGAYKSFLSFDCDAQSDFFRLAYDTGIELTDLSPPLEPGVDGPLGQPFPKGMEQCVRSAAVSFKGDKYISTWGGGYRCTDGTEGKTWQNNENLAYVVFCLRVGHKYPPLKYIALRLLNRTHIWGNEERCDQMLQILKAACLVESQRLGVELLRNRRQQGFCDVLGNTISLSSSGPLTQLPFMPHNLFDGEYTPGAFPIISYYFKDRFYTLVDAIAQARTHVHAAPKRLGRIGHKIKSDYASLPEPRYQWVKDALRTTEVCQTPQVRLSSFIWIHQ